MTVNQRPAKKAPPSALQLGMQQPQQPQLPQISEEQKEQLGQLLKTVMDSLNKHKPILNSLKEMGVDTKMRIVDGEQCLVIPIQDLMMKEYLHMSGVDINSFGQVSE